MRAMQKRTFAAGDADISFISFALPEADAGAALVEAFAQCDREVGLRNVVRQTFFPSSEADVQQIQRAVAEAYGAVKPATSYVFQPPADGLALSAELWALSPGAAVRQQDHVTTASVGGATWGFVGGMGAGEDEAPYEGILRVLGEAARELERAGLEFGQVVRTWYYMGDILGSGPKGTRYDQANRARNEFYRDKWPDLRLCPASTGIGMRTRGMALECLALDGPAEAMRVVWIDNPLQTPPHLYETPGPRDSNPSFSRAAAVRFPEWTILFISGTASIRGSRVLHPDDPAAQTEVTVENIAALIGGDNLAGNYEFSQGATLDDVQQFRVYVKRPGDLQPVRDCCRRHFPDVPATYVVADVCRPEWLVEIEGVAAFAPGGKAEGK